MQKGTKGVHYKPANELRTKTLNIRVTASQLALIKAKAMDEGLTTSAWVIKTLMDSANKPQEDTAQATPAPEQAQSAPSQTDQATEDKPCPPVAKAKTTATRRRKTSTADDDAQPARKSSRTTTRKTTTRRASTSRRKVVAEKDSAA